MKTFNDLNFHPHPLIGSDGVQAKMFFDNGYGVSVVRFYIDKRPGSYTEGDDDWELAVLKGTDEKWAITFETEVTEDVLGYLSKDDVTEAMKKVQELK